MDKIHFFITSVTSCDVIQCSRGTSLVDFVFCAEFLKLILCTLTSYVF
jgi:hypothetical protein